MNWKYLNTGAKDGCSNMNIDIQLAQNCRLDEAYLRLYRWKPYCISIGAHQDLYSIDAVKAADDGIDIVKRPTGGRAILHSEELTYSVIYPAVKNFSFRNLYHEINCALLKGLQIYDQRLSCAQLENAEPDLSSFYKKDMGQICFAASAKSEIKFNGKKLVGSAQRKLKNSVLQHGSILCGGFHKNIVAYFKNSGTISKIEEEINKRTTDLKEILIQEIDYNTLAESIWKGFESYFNFAINFVSNDNLVLNT